MIRQSTNKGSAAYAAVNAVIWVIYVTLVLLATQVLAFSDPVAVTVFVLAAALILRPLRRYASRAAERRLASVRAGRRGWLGRVRRRGGP